MKFLFVFILLFSCLCVNGVPGADRVSVSVMEGDSVTLYTGVQTNQQEDIRWYYNDTRIAEIIGDLNKICTDVQCKDGPERFKDRLKLDHQTGSLTITDIKSTDTGVYQLQIISSSIRGNIFIVTVNGVSAAERDEMKGKTVKEGESVTLDPGVINNPNNSMTWYFNEILITEISGDQSKICTDVQCKERFRDRLKLDHKTGSLTITDIRTSDSGEYQVKITSRSNNIPLRQPRISSIRRFSVTVTDSGFSSGDVAGIVVAVLLVSAAVTACVFYYRHHRSHEQVQQNVSVKLSCS